MQETLKGTVEGIVFRNEENGYTVLEIGSQDGSSFIAVGILPLPGEGDMVEVTGAWTEHRSYGQQFAVTSYIIVQPTELDDIENYLANSSIKGIGKTVARMIVEKFGDKTFDILDNEPERLTEIRGIGPRTLELIVTSYNKQRMNRSIMLEMQKMDITPALASNIYRHYGDDSVAVIRKNPYRLIDEVENVGFKTADKIAQAIGIAHNSAFRIRAGIRFVLEWAKQEGHTYLPYDVLVSATVKTIGVTEEEADVCLTELLEQKILVDNHIDGQNIVFLPYMRKAEMSVAVRLSEQAKRVRPVTAMNIDEEIDRAAKKLNLEPAAMQREAIRAMFDSGVTVITGGPGTGKTTILKLAIDILRTWDMSFELCAPTGRAAKRMTAATGSPAQTIHRLLEYSFTDKCFLRDETDPLDTDFIIVDEMSMVDVQLMDALMHAVTDETHVVLVGDADQLPSVGAGNVLQDIINSDVIHSVRLTEIYRQAHESMIVSNAHRINNGIEPILDDTESDFVFYELYDPDIVSAELVAILTGKAQNVVTDDECGEIQVLAPMKKGLLGVNTLNSVLQSALNPKEQHKPEITYGDTVFRMGDKVMQIKNNYSVGWTRSEDGATVEEGKGVFNGDIGIITDVDMRSRTLEITFESGTRAEYTQDMFPELSLAYCISIHKSQGSEFSTVIIVIQNAAPSFLTRNLLYTAVTRAKKKVCILGRRSTVLSMVYNRSTKKRYTALEHMLREYNKKK